MGLIAPTIATCGTPEQAERFVQPLMRMDELGCQLFSEPSAGSDLASLTTRANRDGDEWVLNGQKVWTSGARFADWGLAITRTNLDVPKHKGLTAFLVPLRAPGVDIRPIRQMSGGSSFNEVFLTDVRIPDELRLGEVGDGWRVALTCLGFERDHSGGGGGGQVGGRYHQVLALAHHLGRTDEPIVRQALADVYTRERILKFLGMRMQTAIMHKRGTPPDPSVLKNFFTQSLSKRVELAVDLEGAGGMLADADAIQDGFWQKQCMAQFSSRIGGGTNEVHRNMIGERALGLPAEPRTDKDVSWRESTRS
jgi:alkylation response protein AidB-like acyl-CoA dehydrogenase